MAVVSVVYDDHDSGTWATWTFTAQPLDGGNPAAFLLEGIEGADVVSIGVNSIIVSYDAVFSETATWTVDGSAATFDNGASLPNGTGVATHV